VQKTENVMYEVLLNHEQQYTDTSRFTMPVGMV